ncbi:mitochondrial ribosomal protein S11 [Rhinolophus ferrumequinum]|uniref:Small ribosomal subunit protein uS11m n=2 Tax=Rhinolophus ferrumequinum TaxID=59479 RepID=A0A671EJ83_RHIFE|nr:28S ribosomal protein S11, mitochondrial [Rhinolophus ferrumequinum]KAF6273294.1 mitochondrial ribosomal protein S11 [Rhinolophus ferrumequinum]
MQVVRNAGSRLLWSWAWPPTSRVVARAPAPSIHTGVHQLQDAAARKEAEEKTAAPAPALSRSSFSIYPPIPGQENSLRWAGKKFEEIPIAHIKASYNNTQIQVVSATNQPLARTSCGTEGFRNAKKGTGIAAQTAGIAAAAKAAGKGVTHIRVVVKGLGPGRLSAIKGLTMGGLAVISITDNTPIPHNGCRPRKARRL